KCRDEVQHQGCKWNTRQLSDLVEVGAGESIIPYQIVGMELNQSQGLIFEDRAKSRRRGHPTVFTIFEFCEFPREVKCLKRTEMTYILCSVIKGHFCAKCGKELVLEVIGIAKVGCCLDCFC